jgi:multiple sugar transport system ATP-binding protein
MDEPLSNLDAKLRVEMRGEIIRVQRRIAAPTLYVTHDQTEAMTMGDRVAILRDGVLQQLGTPDEIYDTPVNTFVAAFIGSPSMNLLDARLEAEGGRLWAVFGTCRLVVLPSVAERSQGLEDYVDRNVILGVRPEDFAPAESGGPDAGSVIAVRADRVESLGSELVAYLDAGADASTTARLPRSAAVKDGEPLRLSVDLRRLYFFDPETGQAIS